MTSFELICIVANKLERPPNARTQCVSAAGFTAVLSKASRPMITLPLSRADALKDAASRQATFESLLSQGVVIAAKPRQWLDLAQMSDCLECNAALLEKLATRFDRQVQFQVSVDWDAAQVLGHFRTAPEMAELFDVEHPSTHLLETSLTSLRARLGAQVHDLITPVATEIIALPRLETTLSNLAVLIPRDREPDLDQAVEAVDALWSEGLKIRQIGPSAPGSFALLELDWISKDDIERAHATLGTSSATSQGEIHTARRRALMMQGADTARVKRASDALHGANKAGGGGYYRLRVLSEDQGRSDAPASKVA